MTTQPPGTGEPASRDVPPPEYRDGGDPACWAHRVCPRCGTFNEAERPRVCESCGTGFDAASFGGPGSAGESG